MIAGPLRADRGLALMLVSALGSPALAQVPVLPPLPTSLSPELQNCVPRFGHTGCAARLYARLLCDTVGKRVSTALMEQQLAEHYEQAGLEFRGITAEQVETAAVRYYAPMLCPAKSPQIRGLFNPS